MVGASLFCFIMVEFGVGKNGFFFKFKVLLLIIMKKKNIIVIGDCIPFFIVRKKKFPCFCFRTLGD